MTQELLLVADDNEDNRVVFQAILQHAGFAVLLATDGSEVLEQARAHSPSLILLDLMMPGVSGWEAMARLQGDPATRDIPVLAVSADVHTSEADLRRAGFCGFVPKPVLPRQLLEAVGQCLEEHAAGKRWIGLQVYNVRGDVT